MKLSDAEKSVVSALKNGELPELSISKSVGMSFLPLYLVLFALEEKGVIESRQGTHPSVGHCRYYKLASKGESHAKKI